MIAHNTLGKKVETCSGLKVNKSRVTACFLVNMDGSFKYPTIIIGKTKKTTDLLIKNNINCVYKHNETGWMSVKFFNEILIYFNKEMKRQNRKVLLFLDNAPVHNKEIKLSNVKLEFFPALTTSLLQPLDRGIISCIKRQYQEILVARFINDY